MKIFTFLILLLLITSCKNDDDSSTNSTTVIDDTVQMVSELKTWYINGGFGDYYGSNRVYLKYFFNGDTIINHTQYKKLYVKRLDSLFERDIFGSGNSEFVSTSTNLRYTIAMREDSGRVYYRDGIQNSEFLYADFNINIGDVLNYMRNDNNATVTEIDSFLIGDEYITEYKLSNTHYFYEGIGASNGLFKSWAVGFEGGVYLNCFKRGDIKIEIEETAFPANNHCPEY